MLLREKTTSQPSRTVNKYDTFDCRDVIDKLVFPHQVTELQLLETHISWVILTGNYAYKIKKPVDLGFVDYSTLEKRKEFCQRELELNRRFAPKLYLDVVPITRTGTSFAVGDSNQQSDAIEFAVKMRQFPQDAILASRLNSPELTFSSVEDFGRRLASFHSKIETLDAGHACVQPNQIVHDADENYHVLCNSRLGHSRCEKIKRLQQFSQNFENELRGKFKTRLDSGKTRRCHGDLHLKNIIQLDGELIPFDGIEFNEQFQCIDVLSEIAFPVMDFVARGRNDLGWRLLNAYLEATDEYSDLDVLRFYLIHRAMVRAKVSWLNPGNHLPERRSEYAPSENPNDPFAGPWDKYFAAAEYFAFGMQPRLSITHGFSGSGKSTAALQLIDTVGGIRIRSDVLRHRITEEAGATDKYSPEMNDSVYDCLATLTRSGLSAGIPVVADASFLQQKRRQMFHKLAIDSGVAFQIVDCNAPVSELRERIKNRRGDASEATVAVLDRQLSNHDPLTAKEREFAKKR